MIAEEDQNGVNEGFTFVDLFAGIGGFRLGLEVAGGTAVFTNEWDKYAAVTYKSWFSETEISTRDIREIDPKKEIPRHDVLSAGFPCQPFSIGSATRKTPESNKSTTSRIAF